MTMFVKSKGKSEMWVLKGEEHPAELIPSLRPCDPGVFFVVFWLTLCLHRLHKYV
jgi:hypothetical protein